MVISEVQGDDGISGEPLLSLVNGMSNHSRFLLQEAQCT